MLEEAAPRGVRPCQWRTSCFAIAHIFMRPPNRGRQRRLRASLEGWLLAIAARGRCLRRRGASIRAPSRNVNPHIPAAYASQAVTRCGQFATESDAGAHGPP